MKKMWSTVIASFKTRKRLQFGFLASSVCAVFLPREYALITLPLVFVFASLMLLKGYKTLADPFVLRLQLRNKVKWGPAPAFLVDLAKKMRIKLDKKRPYGVTEIDIGGAASDMFNRRIIVTNAVLSLPDDERDAVLAHELGHLKPFQATLTYLLAYSVMFYASIFAHVNSVVAIVGSTAWFLVFRTIIGHALEYNADATSRRFIDSKALAQALKDLVRPEKWDITSDTHPSVNDRIARLVNPRSVWERLSCVLLKSLSVRSFRSEFAEDFVEDLRKEHLNTNKLIKPFAIMYSTFRVLFKQWFDWLKNQ